MPLANISTYSCVIIIGHRYNSIISVNHKDQPQGQSLIRSHSPILKVLYVLILRLFSTRLPNRVRLRTPTENSAKLNIDSGKVTVSPVLGA